MYSEGFILKFFQPLSIRTNVSGLEDTQDIHGNTTDTPYHSVNIPKKCTSKLMAKIFSLKAVTVGKTPLETHDLWLDYTHVSGNEACRIETTPSEVR